MGRRRTIIMGAAGRDFHNFNVVFRGDPDSEVVCFTATRSQSVMILLVASSAGSRTKLAPSAVTMVVPASTPKFWMGTKREAAKVRKPAASATVV